MRVADFVIKFLESKKISTVFTVSGGGSIFLCDALYKSKKLKYVSCHHEQAVSFAAESFSRVKNKPGAAIITTGPGGTNCTTGVACCWIDSVPTMFISGQVYLNQTIKNTKLRQIGVQEFDIINMVKSSTKYAVMIKDPTEIKYHLEKAYYTSSEGRPGPVWIDIPVDFQWLDVPFDNQNDPQLKKTQNDSQNLRKFKDLYSKSAKPLFVLGNGIRASCSEELCREFFRIAKVPFVTTWTSQDLFPTDYEQNLGVIGMSGQKGANKSMFDSDLLVCLGTHLSIPHTTTLVDNFAPNSKKVIINIDKNQIENLNVRFDEKILMSVDVFFKYLLDFKDFNNTSTGLECKKYKDLNWYGIESDKVNSNVWNRRLTSAAPNKSCFIVDGGGTALYTGFQSTVISSIEQRIICSSGVSSMGSGLAETIGVFFSKKFEFISCIIGDGSFFMNMQDLQTIAQYNIPVVISVINNNGYLAIRHTQSEFQNGRFFGTHPDWGLTLPNIKKVSRALGIKYIKVDRCDAIDSVIETFVNINKPIVCEVVTCENQSTLFKQKYKKNKDGSFSPQDLSDMFP